MNRFEVFLTLWGVGGWAMAALSFHEQKRKAYKAGWDDAMKWLKETLHQIKK